jgi:hypothetical protein
MDRVPQQNKAPATGFGDGRCEAHQVILCGTPRDRDGMRTEGRGFSPVNVCDEKSGPVGPPNGALGQQVQ